MGLWSAAAQLAALLVLLVTLPAVEHRRPADPVHALDAVGAETGG